MSIRSLFAVSRIASIYRCCLAFCLALASAPPLHAQVVATNLPVADAFVISSIAASNFGGAGALSVSGLVATNAVGQQQGQLDTFMRFNLASAASLFDGNFGAGNWVVTNARLVVTEQGAPNNAIFNRGVGQFEIRWITNDVWAQGTGQPNTPTTDGIVFNDKPSTLSLLDVSLGFFTNAGVNGVRTFALQTPSSFLNDIASADHLVSLLLTAPTNSPVGFTFNSVNFTTASARPFLALTAVAIPEPGVGCLIPLAALLFAMRRRTCSHDSRAK